MFLFKQFCIRLLYRLARFLTPVLHWGKATVFVFRADDINELLNRDQDFTISEVNAENIERHIGRFLLGLDDGPQYQKDLAILRQAVHPGDPERLRLFFQSESRAAIDSFEAEFEVVESFTRLIPYRLLVEYFGVPGPDKASMLRWNRSIFWDIFLDLKNDSEIRARALESSGEMMPYLIGLIQERKNRFGSGEKLEDNFLNRLIGQQSTDKETGWTNEELAGNLAGVFMGAVEPTSKACVHALRQMWVRPRVWDQAVKAARSGQVDLVGRIAFEALRFYPTIPLLMRFAVKDQVLNNQNRSGKIKGGRKVMAMTHSAMFDGREVARPGRFDPDRKGVPKYYLGYGLHNCFGNYINEISIPEMLTALLKIPGLRPASGPKGRLDFEGPFPRKWVFRRS